MKMKLLNTATAAHNATANDRIFKQHLHPTACGRVFVHTQKHNYQRKLTSTDAKGGQQQSRCSVATQSVVKREGWWPKSWRCEFWQATRRWKKFNPDMRWNFCNKTAAINPPSSPSQGAEMSSLKKFAMKLHSKIEEYKTEKCGYVQQEPYLMAGLGSFSTMSSSHRKSACVPSAE